MDHDNSTKEKLEDSIIEVDGFHLSRIISRESSVGQSCHIYYRDSAGVPFKWEMQPGTPKNLRKEEVIPPPAPPPAVQSSWLPKPNWVDELPRDSKHSIPKFLFWKKHKKRQQVHVKATRVEEFEDQNSEFGGSDGEFMGSIKQDSSYSASISSLSTSSNGHSSLHQSRFGREYDHNVVDKPFGCRPWNMTELIRIEDESRSHCNQGQRRAYANESDGAVFKRIFSRSSSINNSCRLYYRNSEAEGVPFKWEALPGVSNNQQQKQEIIPKPSPPPALRSLRRIQTNPVKQPDHFSKYWTKLLSLFKLKLMSNRKK